MGLRVHLRTEYVGYSFFEIINYLKDFEGVMKLFSQLYYNPNQLKSNLILRTTIAKNSGEYFDFI